MLKEIQHYPIYHHHVIMVAHVMIEERIDIRTCRLGCL